RICRPLRRLASGLPRWHIRARRCATMMPECDRAAADVAVPQRQTQAAALHRPMRRATACSFARLAHSARSLWYSRGRQRTLDKLARAFSHCEILQMTAADFVGHSFEKPGERRELLVTSIIEVGRMEPEMKDALGIARPGEPHGELRARHG